MEYQADFRTLGISIYPTNVTVGLSVAAWPCDRGNMNEEIAEYELRIAVNIAGFGRTLQYEAVVL